MAVRLARHPPCARGRERDRVNGPPARRRQSAGCRSPSAEDTDCAAAMGKAPEVAVWVSEVVETVRVSASLTGVRGSLVTPSSSTVTVVLAAMVLLDPEEADGDVVGAADAAAAEGGAAADGHAAVDIGAHARAAREGDRDLAVRLPRHPPCARGRERDRVNGPPARRRSRRAVGHRRRGHRLAGAMGICAGGDGHGCRRWWRPSGVWASLTGGWDSLVTPSSTTLTRGVGSDGAAEPDGSRRRSWSTPPAPQLPR